MKITKSQLRKMIKEELDEGLMGAFKSAGGAIKKAFTGSKLPPLGHMQAGTRDSRKLDVAAKRVYENVLADPRQFEEFFPIFLGFHGMAERWRGADAAAASKKILKTFKSSGLYSNLRSLMSNRKLYLGESAGFMKNWTGDINPLEKENYVISAEVANIVLKSGNIYDLEKSDRNGYIPPGYGESEQQEQGAAKKKGEV